MSISSLTNDPQFVEFYAELRQGFPPEPSADNRFIVLSAALLGGTSTEYIQLAMKNIASPPSIHLDPERMDGNKAAEVEPLVSTLAERHGLAPALVASMALGFAAAEPARHDDLVGVKEAARFLGWDVRRVATYRQRGSFPEPVKELAMGPVWTLQQIEEYKKLRVDSHN